MNIPHTSKFIYDDYSKQTIKILIVDDEPNMAQSIQGLLQVSGLTAKVATDGSAALTLLQEQKFDLVLLDLNMPDMDGTAVLENINRLGIRTNVIVISAEAEVQKAIHVLKIGAKDYIRKPYSPDELFFSIKKVMEKQQLKDENRGIYKKLAESEALHRFLIHNSPDLLFMLDRDGRFIFLNNNTMRLLGYRRKELLRCHYSEIVHLKDLDRVKLFFQNSNFLRNTKSMELRLLSKSGKIRHVEVRAMHFSKRKKGGYRLGVSKVAQENSLGTYGVARDITDKKASEEIISFQNNHDLLTGLPNRNLIRQHLNALISRTHNRGEKFAILLLDINRFKLINDSYGQSVGDDVLRNTAELLKRNIREEDFIGRLGGDEFILILPCIDKSEDIYAVARKILAEVALPYRENDQEIYLTLNIGIAVYPDHGTSWEELMRNVDSANCASKQNSHCHYNLYDPTVKNHNSSKMFVENMIRDAIKKDQLVVLYQPQIDLKNKRIHAVEALVRIKPDKNKLILPGKFIPVAEETDLIRDIGAIVRNKVCRDLKHWKQQGISLQVAINASASELASEGFPEEFFTTLCKYDVEPENLELELTENVVVQNIVKTIANIMTLTNAGVKIAMDDFGTGYSSLNYLDRLPLHTLKLDKSFIQKIKSPNDINSIVQAVINVARGMKIDFIAEGVETQQQHEYLSNQGPCIAQGFFYSHPLSRDELTLFIEQFNDISAFWEKQLTLPVL
jgi:diguanylate cyclase (GGDEF)-like protein/PAS domain S-box-containing protein